MNTPELQILYEDRYITVCVKPRGVLSEEDGNKTSMPLLLKAHYTEIGERTDLYTLHRLDRNVGGVMVYARNPKSASLLAEDIRNHLVGKEYLAVVYGTLPEAEGSFTDLLLHSAESGKSYIVDRMRRGVREATLDYKYKGAVSRDGQTLTLVGVRLRTGRTHQIRVQFAGRKLPLVGDGRYGSPDGGDSPALWSCRLSFTHPRTKKPLEFDAPPPSVYPFDLFGF